MFRKFRVEYVKNVFYKKKNFAVRNCMKIAYIFRYFLCDSMEQKVIKDCYKLWRNMETEGKEEKKQRKAQGKIVSIRKQINRQQSWTTKYKQESWQAQN